MTDTERKILEILKALEDAIFANDRASQLEHVRKAREIRENIS